MSSDWVEHTRYLPLSRLRHIELQTVIDPISWTPYFRAEVAHEVKRESRCRAPLTTRIQRRVQGRGGAINDGAAGGWRAGDPGGT